MPPSEKSGIAPGAVADLIERERRSFQSHRPVCAGHARQAASHWLGGVPMHLEARLSVEDSPNSAGVIVDAIRAAKVALDRKLAGPIIEASAYLFKSPPEQIEDSRAREMLREFARPTKAE